MPQKAWRSFTVARTYAQSLKLKNSVAWHAWWKKHDRPADIPSTLDRAYAEDWAGWEDFLGDSYVNPNKKKTWRSFTVARTFARSLKLKSYDAWVVWWKEHDRPADIPSDPSRCKAYAEDWAGWEDFLGDSYVGNNMPQKKVWRSFIIARTFARSLKLRSSRAWKAWWKEHERPDDIPSTPDRAYAGDWAGWEDFLGDSYVDMKKARRSFTVVRTYAQSLKLKSSAAWYAWSEKHERPADIPRHPARAYAEDWAGWEDFLGDSYANDSNNRKRVWRSFIVARTFAQSLKLKNSAAWQAWSEKHERPADIPSTPSRAYAEDWAGWEDFLGDSYAKKKTKKEKKKTTRKKECGKRKRAGVRKRASTSESESAAKKKRKKKRKRKRKHHHHHQRMETTTVEGEGRQKSNKPFARV